MTCQVSVIIVNWNTKDLLRDCLGSIYANTHSVPFEVIVVDNNSKDLSVDMVKRDFPEVILVENDKNCGFAKANNIGASKASGRYLLLLNSDTLIMDKCIKRMVECFEQDKSVGIVGAQLVRPNGRYQRSFFEFPSLKSELKKAFFVHYISRGRVKPKLINSSNFDTLREVEQIPGTAMMIDRDFFRKLEGFDESYFMYAEDADLCFRARLFGKKVVLCAEAHVVHYGSKSTEQWPDRLLKCKIRNYNLFFRRHYPLFKYFSFGIIHLIEYLNGVLLSLILAIFRKGKIKTLSYFIKSLSYQILYFLQILINERSMRVDRNSPAGCR